MYEVPTAVNLLNITSDIMVVPIMEVVVTDIGTHTIDDTSTEDGREWLEAFRVGAERIPGVVRASWGRSYRDSNIAMHFIGKSRLQIVSWIELMISI
jgi:hypothetical protein